MPMTSSASGDNKLDRPLTTDILANHTQAFADRKVYIRIDQIKNNFLLLLMLLIRDPRDPSMFKRLPETHRHAPTVLPF
jgi:hypothetical protein